VTEYSVWPAAYYYIRATENVITIYMIICIECKKLFSALSSKYKLQQSKIC